jgi:hypothetical protein
MNYLPKPAEFAHQANSSQFKVIQGNSRYFSLPGQSLAVALALFLVTHSVLAGGLPFPVPAFRDEAKGQELAAQIRSSMPENIPDRSGVFVIKSGKNKTQVPVVCQVKLHEGTWETDYQSADTPAAGAERLVIIHSTNGPSRYLYARAAKPGGALPEPGPVSGETLDTPFAGADFSLGDLGLEFLHWPGQAKLPGEMRLGQACFVLESTNSSASGIVRVKSWIDTNSLGPMVVEGFDSGGNKLKEFSLDSSGFKKDAKGHYLLKEMGIDNFKTHSHTDLKFDMPKDQ